MRRSALSSSDVFAYSILNVYPQGYVDYSECSLVSRLRQCQLERALRCRRDADHSLQADLDPILQVEAPRKWALEGGILMSERSQPTALFDIIGTCFSLEKPRQALAKLGAPDCALEMWFAQAL